MAETFLGVMRVKNEARWIAESIESLLPLCDRIVVFDDHSTDNTVEVCRKFEQVTVWESAFNDLEEARDKTWLVDRATELYPTDWVFMLDGDEVLEAYGPDKIRRHIANAPGVRVLSFHVPYYWNDTEHVRIDGSFGKFVRGSAFRVSDLPMGGKIFSNNLYAKHGLHCGCIPASLLGCQTNPLNVALWHYGYMDAETRRRKYEFYTSVDGGNTNEENYRHIIQGDEGGPAANETLKVAGPLVLASIDDVCVTHNFSRRPRE